jgi:3',5'-nucleoside bisphosphate phosphatase
MRIDLHLHSTASDGAYPPADVVTRARAGKLDLIALTDHDTVAGVEEATAAAGPDLQVIPGIEISAAHDQRDLHILGYFIDPASPVLLDYATRAEEARRLRIREMIERLATLDVAIEFDSVIEEAGPDVRALARPHLARALRASGHVDSIAEAFDRFIGDDGPAYVATRLLDGPEAIELIHAAGGLAVWAHPPAVRFEETLAPLIDAGLDGLECYRPRLLHAELKRLLRAASSHGLLVTGGSDWHGDWHGELGGFALGPAQLEAFLEQRR